MKTALTSKSVIICRCDPKQKSMLTKMVKEKGNIVCAVGDGGNDVGMILESSIGIGIEGLEGR
jgi:phospholipid-translocating ATPase